jgi:hypothetical protein
MQRTVPEKDLDYTTDPDNWQTRSVVGIPHGRGCAFHSAPVAEQDHDTR